MKDGGNGSGGSSNDCSSGANSGGETSDDDEGLKRTPSGKVAVRPTLSKMMRGLTSKFKASSRNANGGSGGNVTTVTAAAAPVL